MQLISGNAAESTFTQRKVDPGETSIKLGAEERHWLSSCGWKSSHQAVN
jgi:hypothetical protein